jgi:ABC-type phosphate/phosphonate transport system substrate-binding protein
VKPEVVLPPPATLDVAAAPVPVTASNKVREIGKSASASPDDPDNLVALVLTRPEINSLSDLNNKSIAITEKQSASSGRVSAALMAAGAAEVQFSEVKASAIERLINGEVPAAVVLASREVANLFPEVEGFRTFRVPLKARL